MHAGAWVAWAVMVTVVALATTNPLYLGVVLLSILLVAALAPRTDTAVAGFRTLLIFGVGIFAISVAIATVNGNYGDHVLFTVPGPEAPSWLGGLRLGGPVTAEAFVAAGIRGLAILCVFLAFAVFNGAVSPHRVLRLSPAALFHAGLVVTIGLTLLPSTIEDIRRVREAQALRGAGTGLRHVVGLVVPAVMGGLERSMRLAEAMEARGYAAAPPIGAAPRVAGMFSLPLLLAAGLTWLYAGEWRSLALAGVVASCGLLAYWLRAAAHNRRTTRLHEEPLSRPDMVFVSISALIALMVVAGRGMGWLDLGYNPFAQLAFPGFGPFGAAVALGCAWPALRLALAPTHERRAHETDVAVGAKETART